MSTSTVEAPPVSGTWASRNWWWVLLVAGVVGLFVHALFMGGIYSLISNVFRHNEAYSTAVARVNANPVISKALGEPIEVGLPTGYMSANGRPSGSAEFSAPLMGRHGRGTLYVTATKSADVWRYSVLEVAIEGHDERIKLLGERDGV